MNSGWLSISISPSLYTKLNYDPMKDLAPISLLGTTTLALVVHPSVPANTVADLISLAQKEPGKLNYASSGNGSPQHMSAEMFKAMTRTQITHVPYRGAAPAVADVVETSKLGGAFTSRPPTKFTPLT
jgi:tripartite-type tricarboxylate transporter receptor subunit TctC